MTFSSDHDEDKITNTSYNPSFDSILQMRLSRRQLLRGAGGAAAITVFGGVGLTTPWGTYLTWEENWAGYFRRIAATDDPNRTAKELASFARYGVVGNGRELWATVTPDTADDFYGRWNAMKLGVSADGSDDYHNVANTYGWVVEIDPFHPRSAPKKRTALGRFANEGAILGPVRKGEPLVWYMGTSISTFRTDAGILATPTRG